MVDGYGYRPSTRSVDEIPRRSKDQDLDVCQSFDRPKDMNRIAVVTGATRNLGLELVRGLADRLEPGDAVYLTGPDAGRVARAVAGLSDGRAEIRGEALDVSDRDAVARFAASLVARHGGVDIVLSNHYSRVEPGDDPAAVIDRYVAVNNLGTTNVLRAFAPIMRDGGRLLVVASRAGSLRALAPALHPRFDDDRHTLDDVDAAVLRWRDAVREGRAPGEAWPAWINIPSKIGQVAAVRALARERADDDRRRGILVAALSPGLFDTGASRPWLDMSAATTPAQAAAPLLELVFDEHPDPALYGTLVHGHDVVPWAA
jgi:carbonyl reductase 1